MADKGGKSCPICTEEMDLTDQQLKPCKCGYEVQTYIWIYCHENLPLLLLFLIFFVKHPDFDRCLVFVLYPSSIL